MTRSRSEASPTASGREPRSNETITPLSALDFRTVQRVLTGRLQSRRSTDMVMLPSFVRKTPTAVGRLSCGIPFFSRMSHYYLKQQPEHGHTTPGSCMTIRTRGLPASFGISKTNAGRMTTAFAGTPSLTAASQSRTGPSTAPRTTLSAHAAANHKPVVSPSAVAQVPSTTHSLALVVLRRGGYQPVRLLGGTDKELCEGEVTLRVKRDGEPRGDQQVHRQVIEELL